MNYISAAMDLIYKPRNILNEDEATRLRGRDSNIDLSKKIYDTSGNIDDSMDRSPHCCYTHLIGYIPEFHNERHEAKFDSELIENCITTVELYENIDQLMDKRKECAVFEDDLGPALEKKYIKEGNLHFLF